MSAGRGSGREIHGDRFVGVEVVQIIASRPTVEHIGACPASKSVAAVVAGEAVGILSAIDRLDAREGIAVRVTTGRGSGGEIHRDGCIRCEVSHDDPSPLRRGRCRGPPHSRTESLPPPPSNRSLPCAIPEPVVARRRQSGDRRTSSRPATRFRRRCRHSRVRRTRLRWRDSPSLPRWSRSSSGHRFLARR